MENLTSLLPNAAETLRSGASAPRISKDAAPSKLREQAEEFEAFFISQVLNSMFKGIKTDGPMGGGHAEGIFRELQMQEYGKIISKNGGIGLADAIVRELLHTQEISAETGQ